MTDAANSNQGGAQASGEAAAGGAPAAGGTGQQQQQQAATRPDYIPETYWDGTANSIKPEFGQHYAEVAKFYQTETEKRAALAARKPEDIKFEVKLPDTVKVPEGMELKIDAKDPRVPIIREMALKNGWDQDTVNGLVALDAQQKIQAHAAEMERVKAEDAKLGEKAPDRKAAVGNWLKGLKDSAKLTATNTKLSASTRPMQPPSPRSKKSWRWRTGASPAIAAIRRQSPQKFRLPTVGIHRNRRLADHGDSRCDESHRDGYRKAG